MRTPRGRMATANAWLYFGLAPPASEARQTLDLFERGARSSDEDDA